MGGSDPAWTRCLGNLPRPPRPPSLRWTDMQLASLGGERPGTQRAPPATGLTLEGAPPAPCSSRWRSVPGRRKPPRPAGCPSPCEHLSMLDRREKECRQHRHNRLELGRARQSRPIEKGTPHALPKWVAGDCLSQRHRRNPRQRGQPSAKGGLHRSLESIPCEGPLAGQVPQVTLHTG